MAELIFQGKKVHYEVHGSGGEPIVLLNGIMMSTASWKPFIECMTLHNTLVLVDFFDQGQSERMTESYDHSIQVALLDAVLEEVAAQICCTEDNACACTVERIVKCFVFKSCEFDAGFFNHSCKFSCCDNCINIAEACIFHFFSA